MIENIESIEKEDWKKAEGVEYKKGYTNSASAPRDYSIPCKINKNICIIKGYFIWWCSTHHQPWSDCRENKLQIELDNLKDALKKVFALVK